MDTISMWFKHDIKIQTCDNEEKDQFKNFKLDEYHNIALHLTNSTGVTGTAVAVLHNLETNYWTEMAAPYTTGMMQEW